ncbi:hypothetical protein MMC34_008748, partial [Xylographa carneopallida]|nr:hypothetical protein [Xylographa carneopallida]
MSAEVDKLSVLLLHPTWATFLDQYKLCYEHNGRDGKSWPTNDRPYWLLHKDAANEQAVWTKLGYVPSKPDVYVTIRNDKLIRARQ